MDSRRSPSHHSQNRRVSSYRPTSSPTPTDARRDRVFATDMAKAAGKKFSHWYSLDSTRSYLETFARSAGISADLLIQIVSTGANELRGTWAHPKIAIRFAQWCCDEFAIQVDFWIDELHPTCSPTPTHALRRSSIYKLPKISQMFLFRANPRD